MATVKLGFRKDATRLEQYIKREDQKQVSYVNIPARDGDSLYVASADFKRTQQVYDWKSKNQAVHMIHSFDPQESKSIGFDNINKLGVELVSRMFPEHQSIVVTHFDKDHYHNHIVINPISVNGRSKIWNKMHHLETARTISDQISLENGLKVIPYEHQRKRIGKSDTTKEILKDNRFSWMSDLESKARISVKYSKNYSEKASILKEFGITMNIKNKNISYKYPEMNRSVRGGRLGKEFERTNIELKQNHNRFEYKLQDSILLTKSDPDFLRLKTETMKRNIQISSLRSENLSAAIELHDKNTKYIKSKNLDGIIIDTGNIKALIRKSDKNYSEIELKWKGQAREFIKKDALAGATRIFKSKENGSITVMNEKGKRFILTKSDSEYTIFNIKHLTQIMEFKSKKVQAILNDKKDIQLFKKSSTIKIVDSVGNYTTINALDNPEIFKSLKIEYLINPKNTAKAYINSNASKSLYGEILHAPQKKIQFEKKDYDILKKLADDKDEKVYMLEHSKTFTNNALRSKELKKIERAIKL